MTADFSDLWIMKGLGQLQPGRVTSKYFRHPTERRNNKSTHRPMRPSVLLCLIKHNLKCTHFFVKEHTFNYTTITVEYRTHGFPYTFPYCFMILLLTYLTTADEAKQGENVFQQMEIESKFTS